jgi:hypothetical protein
VQPLSRIRSARAKQVKFTALQTSKDGALNDKAHSKAAAIVRAEARAALGYGVGFFAGAGAGAGFAGFGAAGAADDPPFTGSAWS